MKEMALNNVIEQVIECVSESKQDRLELVLAESDRILNKVNERIERIIKRQEEIEITYKQLDGLIYFAEWQSNK
ncbi:hypothetical protein J7J00_17750 [Bacillus sp. ISL-4]|uniref:hypothetical protein n=1 Tax=Bacillus sp. ISL-4 TaxID=2819125 RepID=UPI001BE930BB|nr:hypothetical protein [Bacillus sp. ISL-4]MBT2667324.1 hypothetical protein [Bacillus sp. ISL-4]MBT2669440.1 hypothetical protein [Streptomyces sp. ISL-14]